MYFFIVLTMTSTVVNFISTETTKEPVNSKNVQQQVTMTLTKQNQNVDAATSSPRLDSGWGYRAASQHTLLSHQINEKNVGRTTAIQTQPLTRLAKTLSFGFDPFFDKGFFEPFERRPKPVTLVAFRKNGILPGSKGKQINDSKSGEVAELQSPYNDISSFWLQESGQS